MLAHQAKDYFVSDMGFALITRAVGERMVVAVKVRSDVPYYIGRAGGCEQLSQRPYFHAQKKGLRDPLQLLPVLPVRWLYI